MNNNTQSKFCDDNDDADSNSINNRYVNYEQDKEM
jgi:hypothetical protein